MKLSFAIFLSMLAAHGAVVPLTHTGNATSCSGAGVWRMIYSPTVVLAEFQGNGGTQTTQGLYCATTQAEVDAQVTALQLKPLSAATIAATTSTMAAIHTARASVKPNVPYTLYGFRQLFTLPELIGIDNFATNPALSTQQIATLVTLTKNFSVAQDIDLTDAATIAGVNYLASCGLLTQPRAKAILAGQTPPSQ